MNVAAYIDHTILKPTTVLGDIHKICSEAETYQFAAVCVPPPFVRNAKYLLANTPVNVATVIGFPFGYSVIKAKLAEIHDAIQDGADELDIVINLTAIKSSDWSYLEEEIRLLMEPVKANSRISKIIVESGILTDAEIIECCRIYAAAGVDFVKTSTGYAETGVTLHAVQLMRSNLPSGVKIKASGGIRTLESALDYIQAGVARIGTSSGVAIMKQQAQQQ